MTPDTSADTHTASSRANTGDSTPVRMGLIRQKPDWTREAFLAHWRNHHGPLAARAPGLNSYWQNAVVDRLQRGIDFARGPWDFDGISQLYFDATRQSGDGLLKGDFAAELIADEHHFLGELHIVSADQVVVVPVPPDAPRARLMKRMSTLKRRADISEEDFHREWIVHRDLVRQMPGVAAYRQNVIHSRERIKGMPCTYEELPIDGIVELWFENSQTLEAAFSSPAGRTTMRHALSFLEEITAFVVEERRIV